VIEFLRKHKKGTAVGATALTAALAIGAGVASRPDAAPESIKAQAPTEQEASTTTTQAEVSQPLTTAPAETTVTVTAPAAEATTSTTVLAKSGENELKPQSVEQVMAQLGHPEVGQVFQENILFTTLDVKEDTPLYSTPDATSMRLKGSAGGVTNAALLNGEFACFNITSDSPERPELIVACVNVADLGLDLDTIQKGSMTVDKVLEDGRGYGQVNGEEQVIAAFNSTSNDVPNTVPSQGGTVTPNPDSSSNGQPPVPSA
jgi:hypothetical protein